MKKKATPYLMLRLDLDTHTALKALAASDQRSMANFTRRLILAAIAKGAAK